MAPRTPAKSDVTKKTVAMDQIAVVKKTASSRLPDKSAKVPSTVKPGSAQEEKEENRQAEPLKSSRKLKTVSTLGAVTAEAFFVPHNNHAKYKPERKQFILNTELHSEKNFALELTISTSEPFKGSYALVLVPVPVSKFLLMELPAELRVMIYEAILAPTRQCVFVKETRPTTLKAYELKNDGFTKWLPWTVHTSIMGVCKEIHQEASPILYSSHMFPARKEHELSCFLSKIGLNRLLLKSLSLRSYYGYSPERLRSRAPLLAQCPKLTHLSLHIAGSKHYDRAGQGVGQRTARAMRPVLSMLLDRGENEASILEAVVLRTNPLCNGCLLRSIPPTEKCIDCLENLYSDHSQRVANAFRKEVSLELAEMIEAQPILHCETGKAKRQEVTDTAMSYVEIKE